MPRIDLIYQWQQILSQHLPILSVPQAKELALWSAGFVLAGCATLTMVSVTLAAVLSQPVNTVRQHLRDLYLPAEHKSGSHRVDLVVEDCFAYLLKWVVSLLPAKRVALALDASLQKDRLAVLSVSVLTGGCAIPVAWRIVEANKKGAYQQHWLDLLDRLKGCLATEWQVWVLTDRGLWAPWLFKKICALGWHPLMRINSGGMFCPEGQKQNAPTLFRSDGRQMQALGAFMPPLGQVYCAAGYAFAKSRLRCTLLIFRGDQAREPWILLSDVAIELDQACWYGMRMWIEHQFKIIKSEGCDWEHSRIRDPERAGRMWLVYAVSLLWTLSHGSAVEQDPQFTGAGKRQTMRRYGTRNRWISLFKIGRAIVMAIIATRKALEYPIFGQECWPTLRCVDNTT